MSRLIKWLDNRFYPGTKDNWDDWLFRERILAVVQKDWHVLDIGAGAGVVEAMNLRGHAAKVCGIDLDPRVMTNPFLTEARVADANAIPYGNDSFDLVVADNVLEHLDYPLDVFQEIHRVLRPGGVFLFKTPNMRHYMPLIARWTPLWFHKAINRIRGRASSDTFPTRYRANSKADIGRIAESAKLSVTRIELIEGRPEYLRFSWLSYLAGISYERVVNASNHLQHFRILLIGELRKVGRCGIQPSKSSADNDFHHRTNCS